MFRDMCTPYAGAPPRHRSDGEYDSFPTQVNETLLQQLRTKATQVWNTDAGADELLAGKEAKLYGPRSADVAPILPALKVVNRDRAHASRRVVKRPWTADEYLTTVHLNLVVN